MSARPSRTEVETRITPRGWTHETMRTITAPAGWRCPNCIDRKCIGCAA